ncbi:MAG: tyrosine--tRNA ligase [Dehalococcoidia bacterium]
MQNVIDTLVERGFVQQVSDESELRHVVERPITLYCGYDPSASSFTVGNLVTIMMLAHFQRHGHRPIAIVGGGTGMIGDPSGKTSQRPIMAPETIQFNLEGQRSQLSRYLDFEEGHALILNNAEWLLPLHYIEFLRDIGRHFSVNQMLATEAYKTRMETGLSFIEFNYMLLQAYDFLHLFQTHACVLQVGGSDQWANCLAGADLIRRVLGAQAHVLVAPLITTASGEKMGKSEAGSIWLDAQRTPPYDFYQFWINVDDRDVERFLALFTFLPMDQVRELARLAGAEIRAAKETLALEATTLTHGKEAAEQARAASRALFAGAEETAEAAPSTQIARDQFRAGMPLVELLVETGLAGSRGAARKLIVQGGAYVNGERIDAADRVIGEEDLDNDVILLRAGKKRHHRVLVQ